MAYQEEGEPPSVAQCSIHALTSMSPNQLKNIGQAAAEAENCKKNAKVGTNGNPATRGLRYSWPPRPLAGSGSRLAFHVCAPIPACPPPLAAFSPPPAWEDQCSRTRCREGRLPL